MIRTPGSGYQGIWESGSRVSSSQVIRGGDGGPAGSGRVAGAGFGMVGYRESSVHRPISEPSLNSLDPARDGVCGQFGFPADFEHFRGIWRMKWAGE
ncbi:MAG: hypothetical protein ACYSW7_10780 [Planctomycetota bacterium]